MQIFFLVALFGMYHALVFLPVLLSLFGFCLHSHSDETPSEASSNEVQLETASNKVGVDNQNFVTDDKTEPKVPVV